ncbi:MAG: pyridoxal phosphate-dependent aminotransferase [Lachnospiraceae bacterium]|nr:pyridoxal phosphate-dependent aminotransferase [Lachnospiraceae bacterium]
MVNKSMYELGAKPNKIRELFEFGKARAKVVGPENVFDYTLGNPSIPAPAIVNETAIRFLQEMDSKQLHGYTSNIGDEPARAAIAADLDQRFGCGAKASEIFITCGAAPALTAILRALAVENGEIMVIAPYFMEYKFFAEAAGEKLVEVSADIPDFQIRLEEVREKLTPNTQALILNSPNNPAGTVYTRETLEALGALLTEKGEEYGHPIYIIADEPYRELVYGDAVVPFIPNVYPNTIVCYSYSKSLSLPGERLGYVYVPGFCADSPMVYAAVAGASRGSGHVCAPSIWQKVIVECVKTRPDLESYDRNRRALYEGLKDIGYTVAKPDGAFYLFVEAPNGDGDAFLEISKQHDLLVVPGAGFGCPSYFRVCYALDYDTIIRSLPAFKAAYEEAKKEEK